MTRFRHRARVLEALLLCWLARLMRRTVPMRRWAGPVIGRPRVAPRTRATAASLTVVDLKVRRALIAAERRSGVELSCLDQAVAGAVMLRRRGSPAAVVVGLPRADQEAPAHAWLRGGCDGVVVGDAGPDRYEPVTEFRRG